MLQFSSFARALPAVMVVSILVVSCNDDDSPSQPAVTTGSIFVQVKDPEDQVLQGAIVLTDPESKRDTTDALGNALLEGIEPGTYVVIATKAGLGSGSTSAAVDEDEVANATVHLQAGLFLEPSVTVLSPGQGAEFSYVDEIIFQALVQDVEDDPEDLTVTWRSSVDGELDSGPPDSTGLSEFTISSLTEANHTITVTVTDSDRFSNQQQIAVSVKSFPPEVLLDLPDLPAEFAPGETISFSGSVIDRETPSSELEVVWTSSLDGELYRDFADENGTSAFTSSTLSYGEHVITVSVRDGDDKTASQNRTVKNIMPARPVLEPPQKSGGQVQLTWSRVDHQDFSRYEIYRSIQPGVGLAGTLIATINDQDQVTYTDELAPLVEQAYYQVFVVIGSGQSRGSAEQGVENPGGLVMDDTPYDVVRHPGKPWLYLLDSSRSTVTTVDYETMTILSARPLEGISGYMDLSDNGTGLELYLPMNDGWVRIYEPVADGSIVQIGAINTGLSGSSVVADGRGHVYASLLPSPWWDQPLRVYDRATGTLIGGTGDFDSCRLRFLPGLTKIIEISMSVSPIDMDYYEFDAGGNVLNHTDDTYHGDHPLDPRIFRISPSGQFLISSSLGAVYTANSTMTFLAQLPHGSATFGDFAFDDTGNTIYAGCSNDRSIRVYGYPGFQQQSVIQTREYPAFLLRDGNRLISVSRFTSSPFSESGAGIEILPVD